MNIKSFFWLFLYCSINYAQVKPVLTNSQKVISLLDNYFKLDREFIHVQFNKKAYVTNEIIGFKGYILSKNSESPNVNTTNINLVVYDSDNKVVKKQLYYATNGTFSGAIQLSESFKSGEYHFHFYTNWMNNFNEDYSYSQTLEIINRDEPYTIKSKLPLIQTAQIQFFPESGTIISNNYNTVGVKVTDCNQKGIALNDIIILDSKANEVSRFNTNQVGNGSFTFIADKNENYTLKINDSNLKLTQPLPPIDDTGIAISYNDNLSKNRLAIVIKTNEKGINLYHHKKYLLLIHQNEKFVIKEFSFAQNETEHILFFDKTNLANGVNSIRLIDENLNQISERLYYHYRTEKSNTLINTKRIANDSVVLFAKSNLKNPNISISILPQKSIGTSEEKSILGTFYLNNYLNKAEAINYFYFDPTNSSKKQDMEVLMLNQDQNKFKWVNIKTKTPKIIYPFNKGVTVSGKIEVDSNMKSIRKLTLISSKNDVFEETDIKPDGTFKFDNFFAQDSTVFAFQVINDKGISKYSRIESRVNQNENSFVFPLVIEKNNCPTVENKAEEKITFSKNNIELATVYINLDTKSILVNKDLVSGFATGEKINDQYGTVIDYLIVNGYNAGIDNETGNTFVKDRTGLNKGITPIFKIDGIQIQDLNELLTTNLSDVDEIYIDKTNARFAGTNSVIDIFLKKGVIKGGTIKSKHNLFMVKNGFAHTPNFKNAYFDTAQEYTLFGTLNWTPTMLLEENIDYELKFPKEGQEEIQIIIEGFSEDGQLISEVQKITIE